MSISKRVETIFAQAVALEQRGFKNTIHCLNNKVYIVNYDHTVILQCPLRKSEVSFENPISFKADDYDSEKFYEKDGKIVFETQEKGYVKKKTCGVPGITPEQIQKVFRSYATKDKSSYFTLSKDCTTLLENRLSHIELSIKKNEINLLQRDIYSGTIIEVTPKSKGLLNTNSNLPSTFGPVGLKTKDFMSLFLFHDQLKFYPQGNDYLLIEDFKKDLKGIMAFCLYDEIIELQKGE